MRPILSTFIRNIAPVAAVSLISASANAAIVFDTLSNTPSSVFFFKGAGGILPYQEFGLVMHVPATSDYQLDSLQFSFDLALQTTTPFELAAFSLGTGTPQGSLLTTFSGNLNASSVVGSYTPNTALTLPAGTDVFFRFKVNSAGGSYRVQSTVDIPGPSDWSFTQSYLGNGTTWTTTFNTPIMQVNATPVPEPGSAALLAAGTFMLVRRRRA
ncbi:MAG: hypothetical protein RL088_2214 [Verrucomicrobiota bacterium]|jgi:hypothetical protein